MESIFCLTKKRVDERNCAVLAFHDLSFPKINQVTVVGWVFNKKIFYSIQISEGREVEIIYICQ